MTMLLGRCAGRPSQTCRARRRRPDDPQHRIARSAPSCERDHQALRPQGVARVHDPAHFPWHGRPEHLAFGVQGVTVRVEGDVNDYCGKGLPAARSSSIRPRQLPLSPKTTSSPATSLFYGATGGEVYLRGTPASDSASATRGTRVVEGVGDHGCEYMTADWP